MKPARAEESSVPPLNGIVLEAVRAMPREGVYSTSTTANRALREAVGTSGGILSVNSSMAIPSYCSEATYLVFLKVLSKLQADHQLVILPGTLPALRPSGQPDGTGIWGRWNANGPGTARLFYELGLGHNFTDLSHARPGDFLKLFWNDGIGASEHGHSVIFLGNEIRGGVGYLRFWSSNIPAGYGEKSVPVTRIHRMLFSRLENPEAVNRSLPHSDGYLSSLEHRSSSIAEMERQCGIFR